MHAQTLDRVIMVYKTDFENYGSWPTVQIIDVRDYHAKFMDAENKMVAFFSGKNLVLYSREDD